MTDHGADTRLPVVAGVDGSEHSLAAADLAAAEAALRALPLELVYAFAPPFLSRPAAAPPDLPPMPPGSTLPDEELRHGAQQTLHDAATRVHRSHPDLPVITRLRDGHPAGVLGDASGQATLIVVGHRGRGGFAGMLAGSVGIQLASHAECPVIITRGETRRDAPVVVGLDGSAGASRAAAFASQAAASYGVPLVLLFAWPAAESWTPEEVATGQQPPHAPDIPGETMRELTMAHPDLTMRPEIRTDEAAHQALVEASEHARLVVVGSRGQGGFRGLLLGSVSQALIHHAHCPVAVIGPGAKSEPATTSRANPPASEAGPPAR
jgi:nucleotide-binding universal stress UspA family protein